MKKNNIKLNVRIKLLDVLNSDFQPFIIDTIGFISNESTYKITYYFYTTGCNNNSIKTFKECYNKQFKDLSILFIENINDVYAWYDIVNEKDLNINRKYKFEYIYSDDKDIITGLMQFNDILKKIKFI